MKYQIDQSGKIEQTEKSTILACTNSSTYTILIQGRVKRRLQEAFRKSGMTKLFIYYIFAVGIFFLLQNKKQLSTVTIDTEYPGKERLILDLIKKISTYYKIPLHDCNFARIGNKPKVHYAAHDVFVKKKKADKILNIYEITEVLKKTDGRLRECLSTLVGAQSQSVEKVYKKANKKSRNI